MKRVVLSIDNFIEFFRYVELNEEFRFLESDEMSVTFIMKESSYERAKANYDAERYEPTYIAE